MLLAYVVWNPKLNSPTIHSVKEFSKESGLLFLGGRRVSNFSLLLTTTISGVSRPKTKLSSWNSRLFLVLVSEKSPSGNQTWLEDHPMIADFPIKTAKITDPFPMKKPPLPQDFPQSDARFVPGEAKKTASATVPNVPHGNGAASKGIDLPHLQRSRSAGPKGSFFSWENPQNGSKWMVYHMEHL